MSTHTISDDSAKAADHVAEQVEARDAHSNLVPHVPGADKEYAAGEEGRLEKAEERPQAGDDTPFVGEPKRHHNNAPGGTDRREEDAGADLAG